MMNVEAVPRAAGNQSLALSHVPPNRQAGTRGMGSESFEHDVVLRAGEEGIGSARCNVADGRGEVDSSSSWMGGWMDGWGSSYHVG